MDGNGEPIYTYNDECMRYFVKQSNYGGRCGSFNGFYKSIIPHEVFAEISRKLDIYGIIYETSKKYFEYTKKTRKNNRRQI